MKKSSLRYLKRSVKYFKKDKLSALIILILGIISSAYGFFSPIVSAKVISNLTINTINTAAYFALLECSLDMLYSINSYYYNLVFFNFRYKVIMAVRIDIIESLLNLQTKNFDKKSSGEFFERVKEDPSAIAGIFSSFQDGLLETISSFGALVYVFYLNYILGGIYVIMLLLRFIVDNIGSSKSIEYRKVYITSIEKNNTLLHELLRGIRDIKILNIKNTVSKKIANNLDEINEKQYDRQLYDGKIRTIGDSINVGGRLLTLLVGILLIKNHTITITTLLIIYMYRGRVLNLTGYFSDVISNIKNFNLSASRIYEIIDGTGYDKEKYGHIELNECKGNIEIANLSFAYTNKKVLKNINLKVIPNETIGIIGKSGAGKTTLFNLLGKNYNAKKGMIKIDGIDINDLSENSLKSNISIITQNPYIFNMTIKENLELMKEDITKKEIVEACKKAHIHDFIMSLPKKYDTMLGEGGVNLSGGQRQRLAIARALLKNTKIILFDEATNALDNETQKNIQDAIYEISKDHTVIIIAHRLSTIKNCDRIYVIDDGAINGSGTHEELLKNNKIYQTLYNAE